jgi:hypothetical protein
MISLNKARQELDEFLAENPELRFRQGLRDWSKWNFILRITHCNYEMFNQEYLKENNIIIEDTFYE